MYPDFLHTLGPNATRIRAAAHRVWHVSAAVAAGSRPRSDPGWMAKAQRLWDPKVLARFKEFEKQHGE